MSLIMDGKKLEEFGLAVIGKDWKTVLGRRLEKSRQTIHTKSKGKTGLSKRWKRHLLSVAEDQLVAVSEWVNVLREDIGEL